MEAANRGARDAGGRTIGLNIGLPHEQRPNPYITPELSFEFHYFFMRKLWFAHLARAIVAFPGGFGTLDELFEMLTLSQTGKLDRPIMILLYGTSYWKEIVNFDALVRHGMIAASDLELLHFVDSPAEAFEVLRKGLRPGDEADAGPALARSVTRDRRRRLERAAIVRPRRGSHERPEGAAARPAAARGARRRCSSTASSPTSRPRRWPRRAPCRAGSPVGRGRARPAEPRLVLDRQRRLARPRPAHGGRRRSGTGGPGSWWRWPTSAPRSRRARRWTRTPAPTRPRSTRRRRTSPCCPSG